MHKLMILVESLENPQAFEEAWPQFLHLAEEMPGLRRETTSRVEGIIFGKFSYNFVHELYFDSFEDIQQAMASPGGRAAGKLLQSMTQGQLALVFADHREDDLDNLRRYKTGEGDDANP